MGENGGVGVEVGHLGRVKQTHHAQQHNDRAVKVQRVHLLHQDLVTILEIRVTTPGAGEQIVVVHSPSSGFRNFSNFKRFLEKVLTAPAEKQLEMKAMLRNTHRDH